MCQVKSSENLEGMSPGGLINRGKKKTLDSLYKLGRQSFLDLSGATQVVGEIRKEVFLQRTLACGTHYGIEMLCLTEAGEQQIY